MRARSKDSTADWDFLERLKLRLALKMDEVCEKADHLERLARHLGTTPDELVRWGATLGDPVLDALLVAHRASASGIT